MVLYDGSHSIYFIHSTPSSNEEEVNTWTTWHLIPVSRPIFSQPTPAYNYVDVPGTNGSLDLTDYLTGNGKPFYSDRQGVFEFFVDNTQSNWTEIRNNLATYFNGSKFKVRLKDEPEYYYEGRFYFKGLTPDASYSKVTIEYRVKPYRYRVSNSQEAGL